MQTLDKLFCFQTVKSRIYILIFVEIKEAGHILLHVDNDNISISNLEHALKSLNVNLTEEDFSEALKCCDISGEHFSS